MAFFFSVYLAKQIYGVLTLTQIRESCGYKISAWPHCFLSLSGFLMCKFELFVLSLSTIFCTYPPTCRVGDYYTVCGVCVFLLKTYQRVLIFISPSTFIPALSPGKRLIVAIKRALTVCTIRIKLLIVGALPWVFFSPFSRLYIYWKWHSIVMKIRRYRTRSAFFILAALIRSPLNSRCHAWRILGRNSIVDNPFAFSVNISGA